MVRVGEYELVVDLIPLDMNEFDAIFCIDWLSTHRARVDYFRKKVIFQTLEGSEVCFSDERHVLPSYVVSALIASKLLRKRCEAYLACVVNTETSKLKLADIPMVCKFSDIFSEEFSGLPPDRGIEFGINLIPDTRPIFNAPYRMALIELRELKI